jgi:uncharacterized membrane protein YagU involved in acid resistance
MTIAAMADAKWTSLAACKTILLAGLAAGAVDAVYFSAKAWIGGSTPVRVLQSIASFWLDKSSFSGGAASATLGLVTHFALATLMAAGFVLLRPSVPWLRGPALQAGVLWGLLLYLLMYLIVMPLRWPALYPRWDGWTSMADIGVHMAVGIAIAAVAVRRVY